jgi:hypothetical protein
MSRQLATEPLCPADDETFIPLELVQSAALRTSPVPLGRTAYAAYLLVHIDLE